MMLLSTVVQEPIMCKSVSWKQISQHDLAAEIAGQKIDLRYKFGGFLSGWKIIVNGVHCRTERELGDSKIMASAYFVGSLRGLKSKTITEFFDINQ